MDCRLFQFLHNHIVLEHKSYHCYQDKTLSTDFLRNHMCKFYVHKQHFLKVFLLHSWISRPKDFHVHHWQTPFLNKKALGHHPSLPWNKQHYLLHLYMSGFWDSHFHHNYLHIHWLLAHRLILHQLLRNVASYKIHPRYNHRQLLQKDYLYESWNYLSCHNISHRFCFPIHHRSTLL